MASRSSGGDEVDGPLYKQHGLVVWAKFDSWCWWPALIVDQKKVMPKIEDSQNLRRGSCMVCFFPEDAYNKVSVRRVRDFLPNIRYYIDEAEPKDLFSVIQGVMHAVNYIKSPNSAKHYRNSSVELQQKALAGILAKDPEFITNLFVSGQERVNSAFNQTQIEVIDLVSDTEESVMNNTEQRYMPKRRSQPANQPVQSAFKKKSISFSTLPTKKQSTVERGKKRKRLSAMIGSSAAATAAAVAPVATFQVREAVPPTEIRKLIETLEKKGTTKNELMKLNHTGLAEAAAAYLIGYNVGNWKKFDALRVVFTRFFDDSFINGITACDHRLEKIESRIKKEFNVNLEQYGITKSAVFETLPMFFKHMCSSDNM